MYLTEIQTFQRHLATATFKLAGGVDLPSASNPHKPLKQHVIGQEFLSSITKAFLETIYAFLDGLVHLASEESPASHAQQAVVIDMGMAPGSNPLELLDLTETVSDFWITAQSVLTPRQENRILLVVSNFDYLSTVLVPGMMSELEGSINVSLANDRQVRKIVKILELRIIHFRPDPHKSCSRTGQDSLRWLYQAQI